MTRAIPSRPVTSISHNLLLEGFDVGLPNLMQAEFFNHTNDVIQFSPHVGWKCANRLQDRVVKDLAAPRHYL